MSQLADLLARKPHVLLDFDGPVCAVFSGTSDRAVADQLRVDLHDMPDIVLASSDPFDVLRYASTRGPDVLARVAHEFTDLEIQAVASATPTIGAVEAITALRRTGHTVTIVSNNSTAAVTAYLQQHALCNLVDSVSARIEPAPDLLKPNPHLLVAAVDALGTQSCHCVLIGDSTTDIEAAHAASVFAVAYANKPGKKRALERLRPEAIIDSMTEISDAVKVQSIYNPPA